MGRVLSGDQKPGHLRLIPVVANCAFIRDVSYPVRPSKPWIIEGLLRAATTFVCFCYANQRGIETLRSSNSQHCYEPANPTLPKGIPRFKSSVEETQPEDEFT